MIRIYVYKEGAPILTQDFHQADIMIGRTSEADLLLADTGVSRRHARLFIEEDEWKISDLGSSNGVYVTSPGNEPQPISVQNVVPGDQIHIEHYVLNFETLDDESFMDMETMSGEIQELRPENKVQTQGLKDLLDLDTES